MKNQQLIIAILAVLLVGGASFFGGMKYQESKQGPNRFSGRQPGMGNRQGRVGMNGGVLMGEVISQDDRSITVKLDDGSSKIVLFSDRTTVSKAETGSKSDLKTGVRVGVFGTTNSDQTVTAQNIQLNPVFRREATSSAK